MLPWFSHFNVAQINQGACLSPQHREKINHSFSAHLWNGGIHRFSSGPVAVVTSVSPWWSCTCKHRFGPALGNLGKQITVARSAKPQACCDHHPAKVDGWHYMTQAAICPKGSRLKKYAKEAPEVHSIWPHCWVFDSSSHGLCIFTATWI